MAIMPGFRYDTPDETLTVPYGPILGKGTPVKLAMQDLFLSGTILPVGAHLLVRHTFVSAERTPQEVIYAFMLPRDAALRRFVIEGKGFSVKSKLIPTDEARRQYEDGVEQGHLSSLAEVYRDGMVNLSVGNIRPDEQVTVLLEILAGVDLRDDSLRFRFPFTLAPCYHPKARVSLTDDGGGEIELPADEFGDLAIPPFKPDAAALHKIGFDLKVQVPAGLARLGSPSHAVQVGDMDGAVARVQLAPERDVPNRDLVLDARFKGTYTGVITGKGANAHRPFIGVVASDAFGRSKEKPPRRVVFLLDRSGSMEGTVMEQAKKAILACLGGLGARDMIGGVAFDDNVEVFTDCLQPASQSVRDGFRTFITNVEARGGTELFAGIRRAAEILGKEGGDIFLVTDGQVYATDEIIAESRRLGVTIHALGIGSASQDRFLALIARATGGLGRFVTPQERVDMAALQLFSATRTLVATGIRVSVDSSGASEIMPEPPDKVYEGSPVLVMGTYAEEEARLVVKSATAVHREVTVEFPAEPSCRAETLRLLRGARLITDLEGQCQDESRVIRNRELAQQCRKMAELERLSREYGLASRAMALVAIVERKGDKAGVVPQTTMVPVGMPQDVSFGAYFRPNPGNRARYVMASMICESAPPPSLRFSQKAQGRLTLKDGAAEAPRRATGAIKEPSGIELAIQLAGLIEADGGMPGRDNDERLAATLIAILTLLDLYTRGESPCLSEHVERLMSYVQGADVKALPPVRKAILEYVLGLADDLLKEPHPTRVPYLWSKVARRCVLARKGKAEQGWLELEKRLGNRKGSSKTPLDAGDGSQPCPAEARSVASIIYDLMFADDKARRMAKASLLTVKDVEAEMKQEGNTQRWKDKLAKAVAEGSMLPEEARIRQDLMQRATHAFRKAKTNEGRMKKLFALAKEMGIDTSR